MKEIGRLKERVLQEIAANGIKIYNLPDCDTDEDEEYKLQVIFIAKIRALCQFVGSGSGFGRIRNYLQDPDRQFEFRILIRKGSVSGKDPDLVFCLQTEFFT